MGLEEFARVSARRMQRQRLPEVLMRIIFSVTVTGVVLIALAGCSDRDSAPSPKPSANTPVPVVSATSTADISSPPETDEVEPEPTPTWLPSLKPQPDTLYLGQGALPYPVLDKTSASRSGRLIVRAKCQGGKLTPVIAVAGNEHTLVFDCDGKLQEKVLTNIKKGQGIGIQYRGDNAVQFAVELVVR